MAIDTKINGLGIDQLALVHVTQHPPEQEGADALISSRFDALGGMKSLERGHFHGFRNSVHTSINHPVMGHMLGNWDDSEVVIIAPMQDVINANGAPDVLNTVDTFWALPEKTPLKMRNSVILQPADDLQAGLLFQKDSTGRKIYYKHKFTTEERKAFINHINNTEFTFGPMEERYKIFDTFKDKLIQNAVVLDNSSPDELMAHIDALPGHFQDIFDDLALTYLRNSLVYKTLNEMNAPVMPGGMWAWGDSWEVTGDTQTMAQELGCHAKPHTNTAYKTIEDSLNQGILKVGDDIFNDPNLNRATRELAASVIETRGYIQYSEYIHDPDTNDVRKSNAKLRDITVQDIIDTLEKSLNDLHQRREEHLKNQNLETPPEQPEYQTIRKKCVEQHPLKKALDSADKEYEQASADTQQVRERIQHARQSSDPLAWVFNPVSMISQRKQLQRTLEHAQKRETDAMKKHFTARHDFLNQIYDIEAQAKEIYNEQYKIYEQALENIHQIQRITEAFDNYIAETQQAITLLENYKRGQGKNHRIAVAESDEKVTGHTVLKTLNEAVPTDYLGKYTNYKRENNSIQITMSTRKGSTQQLGGPVSAKM